MVAMNAGEGSGLEAGGDLGGGLKAFGKKISCVSFFSFARDRLRPWVARAGLWGWTVVQGGGGGDGRLSISRSQGGGGAAVQKGGGRLSRGRKGGRRRGWTASGEGGMDGRSKGVGRRYKTPAVGKSAPKGNVVDKQIMRPSINGKQQQVYFRLGWRHGLSGCMEPISLVLDFWIVLPFSLAPSVFM